MQKLPRKMAAKVNTLSGFITAHDWRQKPWPEQRDTSSASLNPRANMCPLVNSAHMYDLFNQVCRPHENSDSVASLNCLGLSQPGSAVHVTVIMVSLMKIIIQKRVCCAFHLARFLRLLDKLVSEDYKSHLWTRVAIASWI